MQENTKEVFIAGVDEAGRGPLAGPVVAAAVILDAKRPINGLADSKLLSPKRREALFALIRDRALSVRIGWASVSEIDEHNILQATMLAMQRAVARLTPAPHLVLVDGNRSPGFACPSRAIVQGDQTEPAISAASIIAKVFRDRIMCRLDKRYPNYGLAKHKGYSTEYHIQMLKLHGISPIHRRSFSPVAACFEKV